MTGLADSSTGELPALRRARKYSEDEARDARGRWTASGYSADAQDDAQAAIAAYRERHPDTQPGPHPSWMTPEMLRETGLDKPDPSLGPGILKGGADPAKVAVLVGTLDRLQQRFPGTQIAFVDVRSMKDMLGDKPDAARTVAYSHGDWRHIVFSDRVFGPGTPPISQWARANPGWMVRGCDNAVGIATHEFGHQVEHDIMAGAYGQDAKAAYSDWASGILTSTRMLSGYSATDPSERAAEAFAAAYSPTSEMADAPAPAALRALLDRYGIGTWGVQPSASKYSADEARNARGEWTIGGDEPLDSPSLTMTAGQIADVYQSRHPETQVDLGEYASGINPHDLARALDALAASQARFPSVAIDHVRMDDLGYDTIAKTVATEGGHDDIVLNASAWGKPPGEPYPVIDLYQRSQGFHPAGTENPGGYMTHEFGHAVDHQMMTGMAIFDRGDILRGRGTICGYAKSSSNENWAEIFTAAYTPGSERASDPRAVKMRDYFAATKKYSPDQPRIPAGSPEGGEFGSGGSISDTIVREPRPPSPAAPRPPVPDALPPDQWKSKDDARAWFAKTLPDTKIDASDIAARLGMEMPPGVIDKMSLENLRLFGKAYERVAQQYPDFARGLKISSIMVRTQPPGVLASWMGRGINGRAIGIMQISPKSAMQPNALARALQQSVAEGFHPPGCDTFQSSVEHELGHAFADYLESKGLLRAPGIPAMHSGLQSSDPSPGKFGWGLYNCGYGDRNAAEWFAEQFCGALAAGKPLGPENNWGFVKGPPSSIHKYSADQPRDGHGRWTSGSGTEDMPQDDRGNRSVLGTAGLHPETAGMAERILGSLAAQFPGTGPVRIATGDLRNTDAMYMQASHTVILDRSTYGKPPGAFQSMPGRGQGFSLCEDPSSIAAHEYGHAVYESLKATPDGRAFLSRFATRYYPTSGFGQQSWGESFADAFGAAFTPGNPNSGNAAAVAMRFGLNDLGVWNPAARKAEKALSPLAFADRAKRVLRSGYVLAYRAGRVSAAVQAAAAGMAASISDDEADAQAMDDEADAADAADDAGDTEEALSAEDEALDPVVTDDPEADALDAEADAYDAEDALAADDAAAVADGHAEDAFAGLVGLGGLLAAGSATLKQIDAWLASYAADLGGVYQIGFGDGVDAAVAADPAAAADALQITWQSEDDDGVCPDCGALDGQQWTGGEEHPWPGESVFGGSTRCGPRCRCALLYEFAPTGDTQTVTSADSADGGDITAAARPGLRKYSPDQPRDEHGRFGAVAAALDRVDRAEGTGERTPWFDQSLMDMHVQGMGLPKRAEGGRYHGNRGSGILGPAAALYDASRRPVAAIEFYRDGKGIRTVAVRQDAQRQGWATKLYDWVEANTPIDLVAAIGRDSMTPEGKAFARAWLARQSSVRKYSPDQPRDDHGRFGSGDGGLADEVAYRVQLDAALAGVPYGLRERIKDTAVALRSDFPGVPFSIALGETEDRATAQVFGSKIVLSRDYFTGQSKGLLDNSLNYGRPSGWLAVPTVEGAVTHEFGHVIDNYAKAQGLLRPVWSDARQMVWPDTAVGRLIWRYEYGRGRGDNASGYATVRQTLLGPGAPGDPKNENWAEWCSIAFTPGNPRYGEPRAAEIRQTLQDAGIYQPSWASANKYSEDQPRDEHGRWTAAGGEVLDALAAGHSPDIDGSKLGAVLDAAHEHPVLADLSRLHVDGRRVFGEGSLGIDRGAMPQIPGAMRGQFFADMQAKGVPVTEDRVDPSTLKPVQAQIAASNSAGQLDRLRGGADLKIVVTSDGYVLDGHHQWAAAVAREYEQPGFRLGVYRLGADHRQALDLALAWDAQNGIALRGFSNVAGAQKYADGQPRDERGRFAAGASVGDPIDRLTRAQWDVVAEGLDRISEQARTPKACYQLTSFLAGRLGWGQESGYFRGYGLNEGHYWNRMPDGTIVDPTYDQFDPSRSDPVRVIPPGDPAQGWYVREANKYSPDQPRDEHGRFGSGEDDDPDAHALRFDDIRRWTMATREELNGYRSPGSYLGQRFLDNMAHAAPSTQTVYRCAFLPLSRAAVDAAYPPGRQFDMPLSSFSQAQQEAGAYINGIMAAEHADGLDNGTVTPVQFQLLPGAKMTDPMTTGITDREVVTAGRFEVVSVAHDQTVPVAYGGGSPRKTYDDSGVTVIVIRQTGTIKP